MDLNLTNYFNDSSIETSADDRYGITPFAQSIAKSILRIQKPIGTVLAINGPWGSGKSCAVNLIKEALKDANNDKLTVLDFMCWWYRGEEALALAFLQNLNASMSKTLSEKAKSLIPKLGERLLQTHHIVAPAVALAANGDLSQLVTGTAKFASNFFADNETLEGTYTELAEALEKQDERFLVIIDDIDRLSPDEAIAMFRLVKSVGRLPNVIYLLVFDRKLADKTVEAKYPSEGSHYLEKIIQASFELPMPLQVDLNSAVWASILETCDARDEAPNKHFWNIFYDVVAPYMKTPRHVARFQNAISVTWPAIAGEIDLADFVGLETLRLYEPELFQAIRSNKELVCGTRHYSDPMPNGDARFDPFVGTLSEEAKEVATAALQRLFPRLEHVEYRSDSIPGWDAERRVCVDKHFDTYFRLNLSDEALPTKRIEVLTHRADDREFVQETMHHAAATMRRNDQSMVPVYLDELTTHARNVKKEKVGPFLTALFEIHDDINLQRDDDRRFSNASTSNRYHWLIRRLTNDRFSIDERTQIYRNALKNAALGWLVDFVDSVRSDCQQCESKPLREEDCLVAEAAIPGLVEQALAKIRTAAVNGTLLQHRDLISILYRWAALVGDDGEEVREWTHQQMDDSEALVILARRLTGEGQSIALGGYGALGDRVATHTTTANVNSEINILDPVTFRERLELLHDESSIDPDSLEAIDIFLGAWDRQAKGEHW